MFLSRMFPSRMFPLRSRGASWLRQVRCSRGSPSPQRALRLRRELVLLPPSVSLLVGKAQSCPVGSRVDHCAPSRRLKQRARLLAVPPFKVETDGWAWALHCPKAARRHRRHLHESPLPVAAAAQDRACSVENLRGPGECWNAAPCPLRNLPRAATLGLRRCPRFANLPRAAPQLALERRRRPLSNRRVVPSHPSSLCRQSAPLMDELERQRQSNCDIPGNLASP